LEIKAKEEGHGRRSGVVDEGCQVREGKRPICNKKTYFKDGIGNGKLALTKATKSAPPAIIKYIPRLAGKSETPYMKNMSDIT